MSECLTKSAERNEAGREHYGLAVYCARRFFGRGVPPEELIAEAEAALLWAAVRFDAHRGARFSTYAIPFVLGALRELCRRAAPMHVPRTELRVLMAAQTAREELKRQSGREPTITELAKAVHVNAERLGEMLAARERMQCTTNDVDDSITAADTGFEDYVLLKDSVLSLGKPYAQVLWLRYGVGFSQQQVAKRLGVSQPQLSRLEKRGKEMLKAVLEIR